MAAATAASLLAAAPTIEKAPTRKAAAAIAVSHRKTKPVHSLVEGRSAQALFMLLMTMPTIAETIAPDTPPPTS